MITGVGPVRTCTTPPVQKSHGTKTRFFRWPNLPLYSDWRFSRTGWNHMRNHDWSVHVLNIRIFSTSIIYMHLRVYLLILYSSLSRSIYYYFRSIGSAHPPPRFVVGIIMRSCGGVGWQPGKKTPTSVSCYIIRYFVLRRGRPARSPRCCSTGCTLHAHTS